MCKIRSIKQAADYFKQLDPETQITEYTLRKLIADGTIPSIKTGNNIIIEEFENTLATSLSMRNTHIGVVVILLHAVI